MSIDEFAGMVILLFGLTALIEIFVAGRDTRTGYGFDVGVMHVTGVFLITGNTVAAIWYGTGLIAMGPLFGWAPIAVRRFVSYCFPVAIVAGIHYNLFVTT